jgi:cellulose 1,4-beta-cellobiosidase
MVRVAFVASLFSVVASQKAGSLTKENHPKMSYHKCGSNGCKKHAGEVTIDSNWRWTHAKGESTNCYTGNQWDTHLCPDSKTCSEKCVVEGADSEYESTYGVVGKDDSLELNFVTQGPYSKNIGSRTYLMDAEDKYMLFKLKNREFTYTVDDSKLVCGLNGALYFVQMDADGGAAKHGAAGAKYGTGYCDAQCPHDLKWINGEANVEDWKPSDTDANAGFGKYGTCCTELDIWEANRHSTAFTMHSCKVEEQTRCHGVHCGDNAKGERFQGVCDKNGCDIQSTRLENTKFWGPGSEFTLDSTKPVTVTTQFITVDGTDSGTLKEVKQFYHQNGKKIEHPKYTVNGKKHNTISDEFCQDWVDTTKDGTNFLDIGGMGSVDKSLDAGVVLVMSLWDDHEANMLWLDSTYPVNGTSPGDKRGDCSTTSGVPKDVEEKHGHAKVTFSDIRVGRLGTTTQSYETAEEILV